MKRDRNTRRVRLRPTRYGALFLLVLLAMMLGSANYGNNLGFLATFLLAGTGAAAVLAGLGQVRRAELHFVHATPVFAGQQACLEFRLQAPEGAAAMEIALEPEEGGSGIDTPAAAVSAAPEPRARLCLPAPRRGLLRPGALRLESTYPLGLFRAWRVAPTDAFCLVYPAPAPAGGGLQRLEGGTGSGGEGGPGVEEFKGLREYAPGDALQRIAWKHSQRGQGMLTKEFEGRRGGAIVLDYEALAPLSLEERLSLLCRMALESHALGEPFSLRLQGLRIPAGTGEAHLRRCLKALALFAAPDTEPAAGARHG